MARIEYEETVSSLKTAAIWGGIAVILCFLKSPPLLAILVSVLIGGLNGAANLWLLWKMTPERMTTSNWIGLLALLACVILINQEAPLAPMKAMQCLSLGCVCVAVRSVVFGFLKRSVVGALNQSHSKRLAVMDNETPEVSKVRFENVDQAHQAFLSLLPAGMRDEYRVGITKVTLTKHAESSAPTPLQSALGGSPVLPPGVSWPMWRDIPLDYLARINLAELPLCEAFLPSGGTLEFFYGSDHHQQQPWGDNEESMGSGAVIFVPDSQLAMTPSKPEGVTSAPSCVSLEFERVTIMAESDRLQSRFYDYARALPANHRAQTYAVREAMQEFDPFGHRVLSAPARVQGDMDGELEMAAGIFGLPVDTSWVMLLQLESDKAVNWQWSDDGAIYFWIPSADLAERRFDRVWVILQSP